MKQAMIWTEGDRIKLSLPSPVGAADHTVAFPATSRGLNALLALLKSREQAQHHTELCIAHKAAPTALQVEEMVKASAKYSQMAERLRASRAEKAEATKWLEEIGL